MVSQRRNRRGSFQATPVRTRRSRLSQSLSSPSLSLRYGVSSLSILSSRGFDDGHGAEYIFAPGVIEARSACIDGTRYRYVYGEKKKEKRSPLLLSRAHEAHRRWALFCISLDSYRPGASIERPNNEPRTCGFQRAMTQTQFKIEFERKIAEALFPRFGRSGRYGERAILLDSIFASGIGNIENLHSIRCPFNTSRLNERLGYINEFFFIFMTSIWLPVI